MASAVEVTVAAGRKGENWLAESADVSIGQASMSQDHFVQHRFFRLMHMFG